MAHTDPTIPAIQADAARFVIHAPSESSDWAPVFWSNESGWGDLENATRFSHAESQTRGLPPASGQDARWLTESEARNLQPVPRSIARALIVVEGGVVTGTYEDPGVQVRVYDWDMADEEPVPPLPPEWRFLADQAGVPTELRFRWSPETDKADAVPLVLVTMSTSTVSLYYAENSVDVRLVDMDELKAGGEPVSIAGFEDLAGRAMGRKPLASLAKKDRRAPKHSPIVF